MKKIRLDAEKSPITHLFIVFALGVGLLSFPMHKLLVDLGVGEFWAFNLGGGLWRIFIGICAIYFIFKYQFHKVLSSKIRPKDIFIILPIILVVINNFPIIGTLNKRINFHGGVWQNLSYVLYTLSVGFAEECVFLGLIFPLLLLCLKDSKNSLFLSAVFTAILFGLSHLINLFGGASITSVVLQVGYSFLIGGACAVVLVVTKNLFPCVLIHGIYDFGGLILSQNGIASGNQWDNITVIITAILGVMVLVYAVMVFLKTDDKKAHALYDIK